MLLLDCNNLCAIQRHAFGSVLTYEQEQTGVMWGFFNHVLRLAKQFKTNQFVFAWDSRKSFRKLTYPQYKAHRPKPRTQVEVHDQQEVYRQYNLIRKELLPALGFTNVFRFTGYEADDVLALAAMKSKDPVIVSTDKDLFQCLGYARVHRPMTGDKKETWTEATFRQRYGVAPTDWPIVRALTGDTSDNIPGLKGVGEVTALAYVKGDLPADKRRFIDEQQAEWIVYRDLMRLPMPGFVPQMDIDPTGGRWDLDAFLAVCSRYDFRSFLKPNVLAQWRDAFEGSA